MGFFVFWKKGREKETMIYPTLEEAMEFAGEYPRIPVAFELMADTCTPINLFRIFEETSKKLFFA